MSTTAADRRARSLRTPNLLGRQKAKEIAGALNLLLADLLALYFKTKNFHWHVSGPHFRDYHHLLDEQADQIFAITDTVAERARKVGGTTLHSVGHIGRLQRLRDNDAEYVTPLGMLGELREDNLQLAAYMRETHGVCEEHGDRESARSVDRRGRTPNLVSVRDEPQGRRNTSPCVTPAVGCANSLLRETGEAPRRESRRRDVRKGA
jgi:starvation-inducible DNA-binding protein